MERSELLNRQTAEALQEAYQQTRLFAQDLKEEIEERKRIEAALKEAYEQTILYAQDLREEVDERKRIEAALAKERTSLAQRVEKRTAELSHANEELRREITERQRAEEELWNTTQRFKALIENVSDIIAILDIEGIFRYSSPSIVKILGYETKDIVGKRLLELVHPHDVSLITTATRQAKQQPGFGIAIVEYRIRHKNGQWRTFSATLTNLLEVPLVDGYLVNCHDITEHKTIEAKLKQRAAQLALINDIGSKIAAELELDSVLDRAAYLIHQSFGYHHIALLLLDKGVAKLKAIYGSYQPWFTPHHYQRLDRGIIGWVIKQGQMVVANDINLEPRYFSPIGDRSTTRAELCLPIKVAHKTLGALDIQSPQLDAFGENDIVAMQILTNQIAVALENARLHTETERRAKQLAVLHELDQAITATLQIDDVYYALARHAPRLFPYDYMSITLLEEAGVRVAYVANDDKLAPRQKINLSLENSIISWVTEHRKAILHRDVTTDVHFVEDKQLVTRGVKSVMAVPLRIQGHISGVWTLGNRQVGIYTSDDLKIAQSLTDQLAIAIENARLYRSLQDQMQALQETQNQLVQSEKMAAVGQLSASIVHEVNNPLQAIQNALALLEEELADNHRPEKLNLYLSIAGEEIKRVSEITHRLRNFYRSTNKETQPPGLMSLDAFYRSTYDELDLVDISLILEDVGQLANTQLQNNQITFACDLADDLPLIQGNSDHLKQVFLNLVLNAIESMAESRGILLISAAPAQLQANDQSLPAVQIEFSDTGAGISEHVLSRLFEPFFSTKERGSGLGLSVSHKIIKAHQGYISVESQIGLGTTFTILLPVKQP